MVAESAYFDLQGLRQTIFGMLHADTGTIIKKTVTAKIVQGQREKSYARSLKDPNFKATEESRFSGGMAERFEILWVLMMANPVDMFRYAIEDRTQNNGPKRWQLSVRASVGLNRVIRVWNKL